jgi:peptide/nickel transport system permease protein
MTPIELFRLLISAFKLRGKLRGLSLSIVTRLLIVTVTLLGVTLVVFALVNVLPGDPVKAYLGPKASSVTRDLVRQQLGLDQPLYIQYYRYLEQILGGNLGYSYSTEQYVTTAILERFPVTLVLALGGVAVWVLLGVPLGVLTAYFRDTPVDRSVFVLSMIGISLPTFWIARMCQFQFAYREGWFPIAGIAQWQSFLLPWLTLGLVGVGYYARLVHGNMLEVLGQDYIRAARARGLSEITVLFKHALRNAFLPVLTILGLDTAALLGGALFTENVFALPGIGTLALQAVQNTDVPMIMGTVVFAAFLVVGTNLVVDILYQFVDPRIQNA